MNHRNAMQANWDSISATVSRERPASSHSVVPKGSAGIA